MPKRFGESFEWEVSWLRKGYGTSPKREHRRIEERCPKKMETCSVDSRLYTKKKNLSSWLRESVEGEEEERERLNEEARQEGSKRVKR